MTDYRSNTKICFYLIYRYISLHLPSLYPICPCLYTYLHKGTPRTKTGLKITVCVLIVLYAACLSLMMVGTDGECHRDLQHNGCIAKFHVADVYSAIVMIIVDGVLFGAFCYKWRHVMKIFEATETDHKIPIKIIKAFIIQFTLTIIAMCSCLFDGIIHLILHDEGRNYDMTMVIFLFDCTVVATCNFCMFSETQAIIMKFLCFCCKHKRKEPHPLNQRGTNRKSSVPYITQQKSNNSSDPSSPDISVESPPISIEGPDISMVDAVNNNITFDLSPIGEDIQK